jgi:hypothetical protein
MPMSLRIDPKTQRLVARLARQSGRTRSDVVREAIAELATREAGLAKDETPYDKVKHLIGCVRDAAPDLSERTGEGFYRTLLEDRRRRR